MKLRDAVLALPLVLAGCGGPDVAGIIADLFSCDEAVLRRIEAEEWRVLGFALSQTLVEPSPSGATVRIARLRVGESVRLFVDVGLGLGCPDQGAAGRFASARWMASAPRVVTIVPVDLYVPTADVTGAQPGDTVLTVDLAFMDGVNSHGRLRTTPGGEAIDLVRVVR